MRPCLRWFEPFPLWGGLKTGEVVFMLTSSQFDGRQRVRGWLRHAAMRGVFMGALLGAAGAPGVVLAQAVPAQVDINEYYVEGNTALSDDEIERAVYPFLGPERTLQDVERARDALQAVYQAKGLKAVFVEIPQQNVVGGRVRLAVTESRIGTVTIEGARHTSDRQVMAALPSAAPGVIPDLDRFNEELIALNSRSADRQVTPELKPGEEPGVIDLALSVEDKLPLHGGLEVTNRYSRETTETRLQASLRYDDLWGRGHSLSGFYAVAPERPADSEVYVLAYGAPLGASTRLDVTGLVSNSDVATVGSTNVLGNGASVTAMLTHNLNGPAGLYQRVTFSAAWKDFKEEVRFGQAVDRSPITYFPLGLGYGATAIRSNGELSVNLALNFALRGLGSDGEDFDYKRYKATGGFAYLRGGASYRRDLPGGAEVFASVDGQITSEPLISNEQFAVGGAGTVRGYLQSEAIGDNGLAGSLELRSRPFGARALNIVDEVRAVGFVDAAGVWIRNPLVDQNADTGLVGIGLGLRMKLLGRIDGDLDLAFPLTRAGVHDVGDALLHFRLSAGF